MVFIIYGEHFQMMKSYSQGVCRGRELLFYYKKSSGSQVQAATLAIILSKPSELYQAQVQVLAFHSLGSVVLSQMLASSHKHDRAPLE